MTGIEPAHDGSTIHYLDPLFSWLRPAPLPLTRSSEQGGEQDVPIKPLVAIKVLQLIDMHICCVYNEKWEIRGMRDIPPTQSRPAYSL